jgi:hypothetical protein
VSRFRRVRFTLIVASIGLVGLFAPQGVTRSQWAGLKGTPPAAHLDLPPVPRAPILPNRINDFGESDAVLDLYGNEVMPAVATYTFDDLGSLYEVHSPQTEVPRLGSPQG